MFNDFCTSGLSDVCESLHINKIIDLSNNYISPCCCSGRVVNESVKVIRDNAFGKESLQFVD